MALLTVVSDSHLSPRAPHADESWDAVVADVERRQPDLVVHAGDISLNGVASHDELAHARHRLDELAVPWRAVPGNHDLGDIPGSHDVIDDASRRRYEDLFGAGSWVEDIDGWRLVGIDVQTLCSSLAEAAEVWDLLSGAMDPSHPTVLFLHRPIQPLAVGEVDQSVRFLPLDLRPGLAAVLHRGDVRAVVSGHVHQWRTGALDGRHQVWAPTCWAVLPERIQTTVGEKVCGVVDLDLGDGGELDVRLVRPDGVGQRTIGDDFPSPFPALD